MNRIYERFADLLEYPSTNWDTEVAACKKLVSGHGLELLTSFTTYCGEVNDLSSLQEIYTRTFDLNPVCTLDIGYHLFGENYKRGVFLANLHETEVPFELGQERQLPDYLPVLLRLLTKLDDEELCDSLIVECMLPALAKMLKALGDGANPYRHLLDTVRIKLESEVVIDSSQPAAPAFFRRASLPVLQPEGRQ